MRRKALSRQVKELEAEVRKLKRAKQFDLLGQRFGELTVERELEREKPKEGEKPDRRGRRWLCRCDCGGTAIRGTGQLLQARRDRRSPCCRECLQELRGGRAAEREWRRREYFSDMYFEYGTLYMAEDERRMEREVREDVAAELGFVPQPEFDRIPEAELWGPPERPASMPSVWCEASLKEIGESLVKCRALGGGGKFEETSVLGVQAERVRQIEAKALRKLRHPSRLRLLKPYVDGGEEWVGQEEAEECVRARKVAQGNKVALIRELVEKIDVDAALARHRAWQERKAYEERLSKRNWFHWIAEESPK